MKKIMVFLTLSVLAISCGTEEVATRFAPEDNLVTNTALKEKIMRITQHPTTVDDFIDGCSCFSVKMPYVVSVYDNLVTVNSEADYQQVYDLLNESYYDYDYILFQDATITLIYADYHEETIDAYDISYAVAACANAQTELSCVDFEYPVRINTYNNDATLAQSFELGNKKALYSFLSTADGYDAASFTYPLGFQYPDATISPVEDNQTLEAAIDGYAEECENLILPAEPDINDVISNGSWHISYFYYNTDITSDYSGYNFIFETSGNVTATSASNSITGSWASLYSSLSLQLTGFSDSELSLLEYEYWSITHVGDTQINLYIHPSGVANAKYLEFTKN